jgi:hypothetical protein
LHADDIMEQVFFVGARLQRCGEHPVPGQQECHATREEWQGFQEQKKQSYKYSVIFCDRPDIQG